MSDDGATMEWICRSDVEEWGRTVAGFGDSTPHRQRLELAARAVGRVPDGWVMDGDVGVLYVLRKEESRG